MGATGLIETELGVTAIDTNGLVTVSDAVPEIEPRVAVIVEVALGFIAVAKPPCEVMVAAAVFDELQMAVVVRFWVLPSL